MQIDVNYDFRKDIKTSISDPWQDEILGPRGGPDPDSKSKTLQKYHQILWSRLLPNGQTMSLTTGEGPTYLTWNSFRFGSDSITTSFRYEKYRHLLEKVSSIIPDYKNFMDNFLEKGYSIGGFIIFPKTHSINAFRGLNSNVKDRWDLTLECIRRYYKNEDSPLFSVLKKNKEFFDLFVDFKGYVDFFYLQDCVTDNYSKVIFWIGDGDMSKEPLPSSPDEYITWINKQLEFIEKRKNRIQTHIESL